MARGFTVARRGGSPRVAPGSTAACSDARLKSRVAQLAVVRPCLCSCLRSSVFRCRRCLCRTAPTPLHDSCHCTAPLVRLSTPALQAWLGVLPRRWTVGLPDCNGCCKRNCSITPRSCSASICRCARSRWSLRWPSPGTGLHRCWPLPASSCCWSARRCWSIRAMPPTSERITLADGALSVEHGSGRQTERVEFRAGLGARRAAAWRRLADRAVGRGPASRSLAASCGPSCATAGGGTARRAARELRDD